MQQIRKEGDIKMLEKVLWLIANATISSTSTLLLYEPKVPDKLLNKKPKKEK